MSTTPPRVGIAEIELHAESLDPAEAARIYAEHGALVVRGLMSRWAEAVRDDIYASMRKAEALLDQATKVPEGWATPDGTLWLPAPEGFKRDKQIMVTSCSYKTSGAFFCSATDERLLDVVEQIIGPDIELFLDGQCLCKEPVGGHPKMLHQDGAYFEHRFEGPVGVLNYAVPTDVKRGALHVVPGSHRLGMLRHVDTESHLGLPLDEWPWEKALPIEGDAGDAILFHVKTIHGSRPNYSDQPRPVFIHRYRRPDDYITVSATSAANRREAEQRAAEAKKDSQVGYMVRGFRE
jgi:ectoine hydroxylase-related dioxygenase (phytanoyl-CoA dioxygenase family)